MHFLLALFTLIAATEATLPSFLKAVFSRGSAETRSCNSLKSETDSTYCGVVPKTCEETKYRSYDGSCNNLNHSWWGTPFTPYVRVLPCNSYADCVYKLPQGKPNPRTVSLRTFVDLYKPDPLWNLAFMQFGQIIAHDMSLTAGVVQTSNNAIVCCSEGQVTLEGKTNPRCAPILIPKDDPYNAPEGIKCMDFLRTETTKDRKNCSNVTKIAEQLTAVTSLPDVSFLYGSSKERADSVRAFENGLLASRMRNGREVLTQDPMPTSTCNVDNAEEPCYYAGDVRVNQNPQLALLHNIYLEKHNSIAKALAKVNPHWDDETCYQESRRIMIAQHQYILYYEFLVALIGKKNMIENKLIYPGEKCFKNDYDPTVNPGASNEFSTTAFRCFHTEIRGNLKSYNEDRNVTDVIRLSDWFDKPSICEHAGNFDGFTIGLATEPQSAVDRYLTQDVHNLLFKKGLLGQDLKAIDIQRGRDHGLCSYAEALKALGLSNPTSFQDFKKFMKPEIVDTLKYVYKSHNDVDLSVGICLENILEGTLSGPTVQALVTEQFKRTRVGDRCFYENGNGPCAFTCEQLNEIRRSGSMASLLCYNKGVKKMQPKAFEQLSESNQLKSCSEMPTFNPEPWKESIEG